MLEDRYSETARTTVSTGWEVIDEDEFVELVQEQDQEDDGSNSNQVDPRLQKLQQLYDKEQ